MKGKHTPPCVLHIGTLFCKCFLVSMATPRDVCVKGNWELFLFFKEMITVFFFYHGKPVVC